MQNLQHIHVPRQKRKREQKFSFVLDKTCDERTMPIALVGSSQVSFRTYTITNKSFGYCLHFVLAHGQAIYQQFFWPCHANGLLETMPSYYPLIACLCARTKTKTKVKTKVWFVLEKYCMTNEPIFYYSLVLRACLLRFYPERTKAFCLRVRFCFRLCLK